MITLRGSDIFIGFVLTGVLLLGLMFVDATVSRWIDQPRVEERRQLVAALALTDLCLFTEARYTRHPGLADLHSPFQNHPAALEHFPSGALLPVPDHLRPRPENAR